MKTWHEKLSFKLTKSLNEITYALDSLNKYTLDFEIPNLKIKQNLETEDIEPIIEKKSNLKLPSSTTEWEHLYVDESEDFEE